jgi:hypothetical protein
MGRPTNSHLRGARTLCCARTTPEWGGHSCKNSARPGERFCRIHSRVPAVQLIFNLEDMKPGKYTVRFDHHPKRPKPTYLGREFCNRAQAMAYIRAHWFKLIRARRMDERVMAVEVVALA